MPKKGEVLGQCADLREAWQETGGGVFEGMFLHTMLPIAYLLQTFIGFPSLNHILFMSMLFELLCLTKYPPEVFCKKNCS